jgi:two-component system sensor histidine kinase UhpB
MGRMTIGQRAAFPMCAGKLPEFTHDAGTGRFAIEEATPTMSLRARLLISILTVMTATILLSSVVVIWNGRRQVHTELTAALVVAQSAIRNNYNLAKADGDPAALLVRSVRAFDGSRNIRASLLDAHDRTVAMSIPAAPASPAPQWLLYLLRPAIGDVVLPVPQNAVSGRHIMLRPIDRNEAAEVWANMTEDAMLIGVFVLLSLLAIWRTVAWLIAPVVFLGAGIADLRHGRGNVLNDRSGPRELHAVIGEFNALVADLHRRETQTRVLEDQLTRLQDEERAELSRDLHDEIGPLLFLAKIDLASLLGRPGTALPTETGAAIASVIETISGVQQTLRDVLVRLRPHRELECGPAQALGLLLARWRASYPRVDLTLDTTDELDLVNDDIAEAAYRIVKEALTNAMRHATPRAVVVRLAVERDEAMVVRIHNDGAGATRAPGFGISNMQARARVTGGTLTAGPGAGRGTWLVEARLPLHPAQQAMGAVA